MTAKKKKTKNCQKIVVAHVDKNLHKTEAVPKPFEPFPLKKTTINLATKTLIFRLKSLNVSRVEEAVWLVVNPEAPRNGHTTKTSRMDLPTTS